jgi:hypothetical protein
MTADEVKGMLDFNDSLTVGTVVEIRWTTGGSYYAGRAEIVKLCEKSLRARLVAPVANYARTVGLPAPPFPAGREVTVPRFVFSALDRWSANNGAFPVKP